MKERAATKKTKGVPLFAVEKMKFFSFGKLQFREKGKKSTLSGKVKNIGKHIHKQER